MLSASLSPPRRHWLDHRVPPPVVALVIGAAMAGAAELGPLLALPPAWRHGLTGLLVLMGVALDLTGLRAFLAAHTTLNPMAPQRSSALVTDGLYRYSRNPMYVGQALLLAAWGVHLAAPLALLGLPVFVAYLNRFQIGPEEAVLRARFGTAYDAYAARVRRWL